MSLPPLLLAFVAQSFASPLRRSRIIGSVAVGWTGFTLLILLGTAPGIFEAIVIALVLFTFGLVLACVGAIVGSELASPLRRLLTRRRAKKNLTEVGSIFH